MDITSKREVSVTITFNEREAYLLTCLIGALSPVDAEEIIKRGLNFDAWIGELKPREVLDFTGSLYDGLFDLF